MMLPSVLLRSWRAALTPPEAASTFASTALSPDPAATLEAPVGPLKTIEAAAGLPPMLLIDIMILRELSIEIYRP